MIELREPQRSDAERLAAIYIESWNEGFGHVLGRRALTPEVVERWRHDLTGGPVQWVAAVADGSIVGFAGFGPSRDPIDPMVGELSTIAVAPAHWRGGVGRRLVEHAVDELRRSWITAIVWTPANYRRGHAFYEATGWAPLGRKRRDGTEVAFGRDLSAPGALGAESAVLS